MNRAPLIRLFLALAVLAATIAAYGIFYAMVQAEGMKAVQLQSQIATANDATAQAAQAKEEMSTLSTDQGTIAQYFVSTTNIVPFLESLQSIGTYLGASVQVASVSANSGSPYGTLDLSLSISGPFDSVMRTLGSIEFEPYNVSITSLALNEGAAPANTSAANTSSSSTLPSWTASATFVVGAQTGTGASSTPSTATPLDQIDTFGLPPTTNQPTSIPTNASTTTATSSVPASSLPRNPTPSPTATASSTIAGAQEATSSSSTASTSLPRPTPSP